MVKKKSIAIVVFAQKKKNQTGLLNSKTFDQLNALKNVFKDLTLSIHQHSIKYL